MAKHPRRQGKFRDRDRRRARRTPFRDPKPVILIVCEGAVTEPEYFDGLRRDCRNPRVHIRLEPARGAPEALVRTAKRLKRAAEKEAKREADENVVFDAVWCVCDVDEHVGLDKAQAAAQGEGIRMAISNPCFELWLLLHFHDDPGPQHRRHLQQRLRQQLPDYDKRVRFDAYKPGYEEAVRRAERLDRRATDRGEPGGNPTTGVYLLTESIRES